MNIGSTSGYNGGVGSPTYSGSLTVDSTDTLNVLGQEEYPGSNSVGSPTITLSGAISGGGKITLGLQPANSPYTGGVFVLTTANDSSYTGTMTLIGGTLKFGNAASLGGSSSTLVIGGGPTSTSTATWVPHQSSDRRDHRLDHDQFPFPGLE